MYLLREGKELDIAEFKLYLHANLDFKPHSETDMSLN